jgi:hypothetical protein
MSKVLAAIFGSLLVVVVGCQHDNDSSNKGDAMKASADVCSHCAGVQKATADGKCEACGAKVSAASSSSADVCSHCPGVQVATSDGKCPKCGMEVKQ